MLLLGNFALERDERKKRHEYNRDVDDNAYRKFSRSVYENENKCSDLANTRCKNCEDFPFRDEHLLTEIRTSSSHQNRPSAKNKRAVSKIPM